MLKLLAVLCTSAAYAADTTLITFDGKAGTTHAFKAVRLALPPSPKSATLCRRPTLDAHSMDLPCTPTFYPPTPPLNAYCPRSVVRRHAWTALNQDNHMV